MSPALAGGVLLIDGRWHGLGLGYLAIMMLCVAALGVCVFPRIPGKKVLVPFGGLLFVLAWVMAVALPWQFPVRDLPAPDGPHAVGIVDFELTDTSRQDPFCESNPCGDRRLQIRVWYPAQDNNLSPKPYATRAEIESSLAGLAGTMSLTADIFSHLNLIETHSVVGAPIVEEDNLPVVIFSHGLYSYLWQNTVLMEHLASHGYLVYALHHPYDAAAVRFDDGMEIRAWIPEQNPEQEALKALREKAYSESDLDARFDFFLSYIEKALSINDSKLLRSAPHWQKDQLFVLDSLLASKLPKKVKAIAEKGNYRSVAFAGMSFGGSTAMAACHQSEHCIAQINLDGADSHFGGVNKMAPAPLLHLYQDHHRQLQHKAPDLPVNKALMFNDFSIQAFERETRMPKSFQYIVSGSNHFGFTDSSVLLAGFAATLLSGEPDGERLLELQNDFVAAFLDQQMRNRKNGFPERQEAEWGSFVMKHKAEKVPLWWEGLPDRKKQAWLERLAEIQGKLKKYY
ncbi:alpha/beta hydrolase family protein [Pseudoteredinibacter isoporae]|uniref:Putative dienelactone hydrolase n=1 Tax=Pseudoteredinibacter isoporae TaxID=570281 RepID=A0A7X0MV43_9GAMM|nr:hypothetical protein [Pseudoteredinibacter isoporae]MBB6521341.1 putative dienelactone hydrolase [Pseudoteredinibacter isoporae]NHO86896.1 hypothetical protein [Pseudoteredinibacter isoporae]NIB24652.1 hypothetical protein [Pseudoteredinibacter isoporae]